MYLVSIGAARWRAAHIIIIPWRGEGDHERSEEKDPAASCRSLVAQQLAGAAQRAAESTVCAAFVPFRHLSRSRRLLSRAGDPWCRKKSSETASSRHDAGALSSRRTRSPAHAKASSAPTAATAAAQGPSGCGGERRGRRGRRWRAAAGLAAALRCCSAAGPRGRAEVARRDVAGT